MVSKKSTMVSVLIMAYNHEKYIANAIEGVLMQKVNFGYEIIIGEDCSTDNTRAVIVDYATKYPDKIKIILHESNVGAKANQLAILNAGKGKYIAFCEGDDYWIDEFKLQRQVDFLETHTDYVLTHTGVLFINNQGQSTDNFISFLNSKFRIIKSGLITKFLAKKNYIITVTVLILREALLLAEKRIEENLNQVANIDYTLFMELSILGKINYENKRTAAYRVLTNSASHSLDLSSRFKFIESTINISRFYNHKFSIGIDDRYFDRLTLSAKLREFAQRKLVSDYRIHFYEGIKQDRLNIFRLKNYYYFIISLLSKK